MRIAVDTRLLQSAEMPEASSFTKEVFLRLAEEHADSEFVFLVDQTAKEPILFPKNVTVITVTPAPKNFLLYKWWYDVKLLQALQKVKASVFIATYGLASLTTSVPQILIVKDLIFLHRKNLFSYNSSNFQKRFTGRFIKKAKAIVTLSNFIKKELVRQYGCDSNCIKVIASASSEEYRPISWEEKERVKEQLTQGCEYFIFQDHVYKTTLLAALKAFSIFKKWQKTNMKLLVTGPFNEAAKEELQKLKTYKYKNDVIVHEAVSPAERPGLLAASYALIYPSFYDGFGLPVLEALQSAVPVITAENSSMSELAGEAALYINPAKPEEIAAQMKTIFKDEQLRTRLIEKGIERAAMYDWNKTASLLWKVIEEAVSK